MKIFLRRKSSTIICSLLVAAFSLLHYYVYLNNSPTEIPIIQSYTDSPLDVKALTFCEEKRPSYFNPFQAIEYSYLPSEDEDCEKADVQCTCNVIEKAKSLLTSHMEPVKWSPESYFNEEIDGPLMRSLAGNTYANIFFFLIQYLIISAFCFFLFKKEKFTTQPITMKLTKMNAGQIITAISGVLLITGNFLPWVEGRVMGMLKVYGIYLSPDLPGIDHGLLGYLDGYILIVFGIISVILLFWGNFISRLSTLIISIAALIVALYDLFYVQMLYEDFVHTDIFNGAQAGLFFVLIGAVGLLIGSAVNLYMQTPKYLTRITITLRVVLAVLFTIVSKFIGVKCGMAEPGGINEGWGGFPVPYYSCGAWGDNYFVPFLVLNFIAWMLIFLGISLLFKKIFKKQ